jgi:hypothetical protein
MQALEVYRVLQRLGATTLHHANSVTTSCTFLEQGGLVSREYVEVRGLSQTGQSSDVIDKKYGIWNGVFVDHVDIHGRAGRRKGPNQYGPVLFLLDLEILLGLPQSAGVFVTKRNPVHWYDNQPDSERWFQSVQELEANIHFGDFDKMLVIQTESGKLDFPNGRAQIMLDDPQRQVSVGQDAYANGKARLEAAAAVGGIQVCVEPHDCRSDCICVPTYAKWNLEKIDFHFT